MNKFISSFQDAIRFSLDNDEKDITQIVANAIQFGEIEAISIVIALHKFASIAASLRENANVLHVVEEESFVYSHSAYGYKIGFQHRKQYNFNSCNDPFLSELEAQKKEAEKQISQRKEFLKSLRCEASDQKSEGVVILPPKITSQKVLTLTRL